VAIRLPIARVLTEIGRMAARKPTINKPKLNQPLDQDRFHEMQCNYPWTRSGAH